MRSLSVLAAFVLGLLVAAGCDTVELGDPPADVNACRPDQAFFFQRVWPEFLNKTYDGKKCGDAGCHTPTSGRPLVIAIPTSAPAVPLPSDWMTLYLSVTEQMQCTNVSESALLTRPDGRTTHGGGRLIQVDGAEAQLVRAWVNVR